MEQKKHELPLFVTIPHSGERIPDFCGWLKGLPEVTLMRDVDRFVDQLYQSSIQKLSLPFVQTEWHRYAADLNRVPGDVDAGSVLGAKEKPGVHNRGFHWTVTTLNESLMAEPISQEVHQKLVKLIYEPFHQSVEKNYENFRSQGFKDVFHLDLHSMPSVGTAMHRDPGERRADIVVSDCHGKSSVAWFVDLVIAGYVRAGFKVAYNWPYYGGRVSEQYGQPLKGQHAVQVELNRDLYMDEETKKIRSEKLLEIQAKLQRALGLITEGLKTHIHP